MFITDKSELLKYGSEKRVWQGIPGIERTQNGRLFATFYSGGTKEELGNYVLLIKSDDDGETWSEPIAVVGGEDKYRFYDECLWIDPMGRLWFTWTKAPAGGVYAAICDEPDADILEWSEEFLIGRDVMMNKPTVLSTGEWLFPIALWEAGIGMTAYECMTRPEETGAFVYMTNDSGKSFSKIGNCIATDRLFEEHMMVELNDGSIMMLIRNRTGVVKAYSYDGGKTWSKTVPFEIPVPSSRIFIRRLSSGKLLLVCNNHESQRINMTAFLSEDDGETWIGGLLLDDRDSISYPDAVEGNNGFIYVIYDRERGGFKSSLEEAQACAREILLAKITEEDILKGEASSSQLRKTVNKLGEYKGEDLYNKAYVTDEDFIQGLLDIESTDKIIMEIVNRCSPSCEDMQYLKDEAEKFAKAIEMGEDLVQNIKKLMDALRLTVKSDNHLRPVVNEITAYIREHLDEEINLEQLAQKHGISMYYMCHAFRKLTGLSVVTYRNSYRLSKAKRLMVNTDKTLTEIALECGFNDQSYFARTFKEIEKITPSEYRKRFNK